MGGARGIKRGMAEPTPFLTVVYSDATW